MDLSSDFSTLEQLVPFMPGHVYLLDKRGVYRGCNDLQAKSLGLVSASEIIGKTNKMLPPFRSRPDLATALDSNNEMVMQQAKPFEFEEECYDPNGKFQVFKSYKIPVLNSNKEVIGLLGISFDISEAKEKLKELHLKQAQAELALDNIMANLPGHVYWVDINNKFLGCNDAQANDFGLKSREEIVGLSVSSFQTPQNADKIIKNNSYVMEQGKALNEEELFLDRQGNNRVYLSSKVPLRDKDNGIVGLLGISFDITELKRAQENEKLALQKAAVEEATKRALLIFSGMSTHDLRTPLSSISLRAAFLKKYVPALLDAYTLAAEADLDIPHIQPKVLKDLPQAPEDILQGVREANEYIDASLKSLKGASSGDELMNKNELVECDVGRLLRRIVDNYPYKEGQEALLHYDAECDFHFKGNVIFFNRLIENLIKNAFEQIQAKGKGEVFIHCESQGNLNLIKIKDTAGGVTQPVIDQLFNGIQSTKAGGTGIGLSSAKQIMRGMNGDIRADLVEGDSIEFSLSFPK